jgi:hypothetical protein
MTLYRRGNSPISQDERCAIRNSDESLRVLARRYGINPKTVAKWKHREDTADRPRGPRPGSNCKLTAEEEGIIVHFREYTLLPLDDCLYALQAQIPHLSRSSLHRCLQRHGVNRLSAAPNADTAIVQDLSVLGDLQIDSAQVRSHDGPHHLFNAIEQASKFVFVQMGSQGDANAAADFLTTLTQCNPCRIRRVFTLDAAPFVSPGGESPFAQVCREHGIEHCLAAVPDPWTRNSGSRMGDMLQDVTFPSEAYLVGLLGQFVHAYNYRRRLKTLRGKTPHEFLCKAWFERPDRFLRDPHHGLLGLEFAYG